MTKKIIPTSAKLISQSKKNFGFATAFEYKPIEAEEKSKGTLYIAIEVSSLKEKATEIVELVLQVIKHAYYSGKETDIITNFENALTKLNEELAVTIEEGKVHWLGKMHAVIAVLADSEIHITKTGDAKAFLLRGENLVEVTKELSGPTQPHPLKTFVNIASGTGEVGDKLFLTTPGIQHFFDVSEISNFIKEYSPQRAIAYLADLIDKNEKEGVGSLFVLEFTTPEVLANQALEGEPEEIWVGEEESAYKAALGKITPTVAKAAGKTASILGKAFGAASIFTTETLAPAVKKGTKVFSKKAQEGLDSLKEKEAAMPEKSEAEIPAETVHRRGLELQADTMKETETDMIDEKKVEEVEKEISTLKEERLPELITRHKKPAQKSAIFSVFKNNLGKINNLIPKPKNILSKKSRLPLIIGVFALIFGISIFFNYNSNVGAARFEKILVEAQGKEKEAADRLIFDDKAGAAGLLREAREKISALEKTRYKKEEVASLISRIDTQLEKAEGVVRVENTPFADLSTISGAKPQDLFIISGALYSYDQEHNSIYKVDLASKEVGTNQASPAPGEKFLSGTLIDEEKIVFLSDRPGIWAFDPDTGTVKKQTLATGDWPKADDISSYYSNIYLLSKGDSGIKKFNRTTGGFSPGTDYLKKEADLSQVRSLAIDGNAYVLKENGEVLAFYGGILKEFSLKNMPGSMQNPKKVYTNIDLDQIYILDNGNKRILVLDKEGNFVKQFKSDGFEDMKGIAVDTASGKGYVLSGTKVFEFGL